MSRHTATIIVKDEVNVRIKGLDPDLIDAAQDRLTFFVPGYVHMPAYKLGRWDGMIRLFSKTGTTYMNLLEYVIPLVEDAGYDIVFEDKRGDWSSVTDVIKCINNEYLSHCTFKGEPLTLRQYQIEAINTAIIEGGGILEMATGSGKTLVCATLSKVYSEFGYVVVIVPNIDLVLQTQHTFKQLGLDTGLWYGGIKERKQITIATWQSLDHFPELFAGVSCVIVDEVHQAKAKILNEMLTGPACNVPFRFGCTGTLPKEELFRLQIEGCLGKEIFVLRTWQLQNEGVLANTNIYQIKLNDAANPDYIKRTSKFPFEDWNDELSWLLEYKTRLNYIAALLSEVRDNSGNTLVLVPFRKHGKALEALIPNSMSLDGRDKNRLAKYEKFNDTDDNILICTYGIAATGIDIPRIFNLVMLEPGKKFEKVTQVLGRGLRKADDKHSLNVYDVCSNSGMSSGHATKRRKLFKEARQQLEIIEVEYN